MRDKKKIFLIAGVVVVVLLIGYALHRTFRHGDLDKIVLYGNVDVRQVNLGFRVPGRVTALLFQEGDLIVKDMLIALLDEQPYADLVDEAKASVEAAQAQFDNSLTLLKRREELVGQGGVSQEDLDNARAAVQINEALLREAVARLSVAKENLSYTHLRSLSEGTVLTRIREPGTVVRDGDPVYTLSLLDPVWVRAFVSEPDLGRIYPGMKAMVYTDTPGGSPYEGQIGFISPVAEFTPKTVETTQLRTDLVYRIRVVVNNPDKGLRQGMPVTVKLDLRESRE